MKKERGLNELYKADPLNADDLLWGRQSNSFSRRGFLRNSALAAIGTAVGGPMVFGNNFPAGLIPAALLEHTWESIPGKHADLVILNDRPLNVETPAHLLDDALTPNDKFFIRNNGIPPANESIDKSTWTLTIDGEAVPRPKTYTLSELKSKFQNITYQHTLECAGNGRKEFSPATTGNQWTTGGIGCAAFTGVRLRDVLQDCGVTSKAVYVGYYGADKHINGSGDVPISRGVPIAKAMEEESLIAWATQDGDLPWHNGYPLRLVFGGWPASCSGKWLQRISVRDKVHDGAKMTGMSYKMPCEPIAPGAKITEDRMCIIEAMPVKSLITYPKTGAMIPFGKSLKVRGHAWVGDRSIKSVFCSIDFGMTWKTCSLQPAANKQAWQHFSTELSFPKKGYYEVWARATDSADISQPMLLPGWNPEGYCNNACHRIAVMVK